MTALRIRLLGGLQLWRGDDLLPAFPTQRARSLFAYLALNRSRLHAREQLIGRLWGDEPEDFARKALRMALWRVRRVVDADSPVAEPSLRVSGSSMGFNLKSGFWLDIEEFERLLDLVGRRPDEPLDANDARHLRAAIDLYRGDLLEDSYEDWCLYERERFRLLYHSALERLMRFEQERAAWEQAIALGQRLLALDPLMEQVHRELMLCYVGQGSRASALRQFEICAQILRRELDVEPMFETTELYQRIRGESDAARSADRQARQLLERVDQALDALYGIAGQLEETRGRLRPPVNSGEHNARAAAPLLAEALRGRS